MDCILWVISLFLKFIWIMVVLVVCLCMWLSGVLILGNIYFLCLLMIFIKFKICKVFLFSGILWGFFIFINFVGMFYMLVLILIFDYFVWIVLSGWIYVRSCYLISSFVFKWIEVLFRVIKKWGSLEGGNVGIFCFFGLLNCCFRLFVGLNFMSFFVVV